MNFKINNFQNRALMALSAFLMLLPILSCSQKAVTEDINYYDHALQTTGSFLQRHSDHIITYKEDRSKYKWFYEQGLMLNALYEMYQYTGKDEYLQFMKRNIDLYVNEKGEIDRYKYRDFNLDNIGPGRALIHLFSEFRDQRYRLAADTLFAQLKKQPRTSEGGFWHKKVYPYQMWLDGLYMAQPFAALYRNSFVENPDYRDIIDQFRWIYSHTHDPATGLLYHAWNEDREQFWADPETGLSKHFWGRAVGWYMMALVDVLEFLPDNTAEREILITQLKELAPAIAAVRDKETGLWYQVLNLPEREGNYLESSASAMFIYAFAKAVNMEILENDYLRIARGSFASFIHQFTEVDSLGLLDIKSACAGAGLGGKKMRDGSFEYYVGEETRTNDYKVYGPFIMAALELHQATENEQE